MSDFRKVFGNNNIISLDGTISRGRSSANSFSQNTRPIVLKSKKDLVRESPTNEIILPSTKGVIKPIVKPPFSKFETKTTPTFELTPPIVEKITSKPVVVVDRETKQLSQIPPIEFRKSGEIELTGEYNQNKIKFDRYSFDDIVPISSVTFQFILRLISNDGERYYTSSDFKNKLSTDYANNIPYRALSALNPESVVTVDLRKAINSIGGEYFLAEQADGVLVKYNTFVDATGVIDYTKIIEYIDWVVSKPPQEYDDRTIPAMTLGNWQVVGGTTSGGTAVPTKSQPSEGIPNVYKPEVIVEPPIKTTPQKPPIQIIPKDDKPKPKPKPIGSPIAELPIIKPVPNRFSGFSSSQQTQIQRSFTTIIGGGSLVPREIPVNTSTLQRVTGVDFSDFNSPQVKKPRNLL